MAVAIFSLQMLEILESYMIRYIPMSIEIVKGLSKEILWTCCDMPRHVDPCVPEVGGSDKLQLLYGYV